MKWDRASVCEIVVSGHFEVGFQLCYQSAPLMHHILWRWHKG